MSTNESFLSRLTLKLYKIILILCAVYFFMMGTGLICFPRFLIKGFSDVAVNPVIIGMLRGAGGSILPYSLLYLLVYQDPYKRLWALPVILMANITAITLDIISLILGEYKFSYAMIDIPIEVVSIIGLWIIWSKRSNR